MDAKTNITPARPKASVLTDTKIASIKPASIRVEYPDLKVVGLRLRIGISGTKTWVVRARSGSKVLNRKLGAYPSLGLGKAREAAEKMLAALARDGTTEALDRTFGMLAEAWIEKVAKPNNRSWQSQERRLELHVLPKWRDRKLTEIRRTDVRELVEGIDGDVLPNRVLTNLKTLFRFALSRDWIDASPVEGVEKPKADVSRDRVLDMGEVKRVWTAVSSLNYPFGPYLQILMLTAQRRSEVASMRWEAVDLDAGIWTLEASETKSSRAHLVPLSAPALEILKSLPRFGDYVFSTNGDTHISGFTKLKSRLDTLIAKDDDGELKPWVLHDLRRTAATHMVRLGVLEEVVGKVLNHASVGVTARTYALHRYEPEKRSALDRWAAELTRALSGDTEEKVVPIRSK